MKIYVLTIHNPNISMGPNMRLQGFLNKAESQKLEYILPKFPQKKNHSKIHTVLVLLRSLRDIIKNRKEIDMIHVVTPPSYPGLIAVFAKKILRLPYIVDIGDPYAENMALIKNWTTKSIKFKILKRIDNLVYKNSSHLILTSPELTKYIPSQIPHTTILTGIKSASSITPSPLPKNKKCLYLGQYGPLQNLEYIIKVFSAAIKKDPQIQLHIIGQGKCDLDSEKNIKFFSPIQSDAVPSLIEKYTCGIVSLDLKSTLDYAIPTKLLTYLCHGLPVFGTGGIATKTITREANAGVITTKYNLHEDTDNLLRLLKDPEKLENYSKNAVLFAKKNLSLESCSKKAQKIYKFHLQ